MGDTKKKRGRKSKKNDQQENEEVEFVVTTKAAPNATQEADDHSFLTPAVELSEKGINEDEPIGEVQVNEDEPIGEVQVNEDDDHVVEPRPKRQRGPTRMKDIAKDRNARVKVDFTFYGEPCGPGSVKLSSYLGPLVREHVPITLDRWTKISEDQKIVLWRSIQERFELDEEYQRSAVFKQMGCLFRSSKSRMVKDIREACNNQQRMNLRPKNVNPIEWRKFVKLKTSEEFKLVSESYRERKRKQIPHTCSRKGMVRLTEEMKNETSDPSQVTRMKVWVKSRTKKDGTPVNALAAEKIQKAAEIGNESNPTNDGQDSLSQMLGPDNPGRMRAMGRHMTKTKLACFQVKQKCMTDMQENQVHLNNKVLELEEKILKMGFQRQETEVGENSTPKSVNKKTLPKCFLLEWDGGEANVAEGRIISSDPNDLVNDTRLGPTDVKVLVDIAILPEAFLWRPASNMFTIEEAVGNMIAWPADKCVNQEPEHQPEHIEALGSRTNSLKKCKLLDLTSDDVVVAEGRWHTKDPKALVNGLPLGPNAVKVYVDVVHQPETFIWRPTMSVTYLDDCVLSFVSWPAAKVVFQDTSESYASIVQTAGVKSAGGGCSKSTREEYPGLKSPRRETPIATPSPLRKSPRNKGDQVIKANQSCKIFDINGTRRVVAEGRVHSTDPEQKVHFVRLGSNAARIWIDKVKVDDAAVWRTSDEIEYMRDALGSSIAWPIDKLVIF